MTSDESFVRRYAYVARQFLKFGAVGGAGLARLAPAWGDWTPFMVADFTCRGAKFRLDFASGNAQHNIAVAALAVAALDPA